MFLAELHLSSQSLKSCKRFQWWRFMWLTSRRMSSYKKQILLIWKWGNKLRHSSLCKPADFWVTWRYFGWMTLQISPQWPLNWRRRTDAAVWSLSESICGLISSPLCLTRSATAADTQVFWSVVSGLKRGWLWGNTGRIKFSRNLNTLPAAVESQRRTCVWKQHVLNESGQRGEIMELVLNAASAVGGLIAGFTNYITDLFLTPPLTATLRYLEDTDLKMLAGGESQLVLTCFYRRAPLFINASDNVESVELKGAIVQLLLLSVFNPFASFFFFFS